MSPEEYAHRVKLSSELREHRSFRAVAKLYGVSDNAIRKRCRKLNLPDSSSVIKRIPDEEWDYAIANWNTVKDKYGSAEPHLPVTDEEIAEIKRLAAEGNSIYAIGKELGRDRKTVKAYLDK